MIDLVISGPVHERLAENVEDFNLQRETCVDRQLSGRHFLLLGELECRVQVWLPGVRRERDIHGLLPEQQ